MTLTEKIAACTNTLATLNEAQVEEVIELLGDEIDLESEEAEFEDASDITDYIDAMIDNPEVDVNEVVDALHFTLVELGHITG